MGMRRQTRRQPELARSSLREVGGFFVGREVLMLEQDGQFGVGLAVAARPNRPFVVLIPQVRVPLGVVNADRPVFREYRGEGSVMVNLKRVIGGQVYFAALAGAAVPGEDRAAPSSVCWEGPAPADPPARLEARTFSRLTSSS